MLKILGITVLLGGVFLLGYYTGQRPAEVRKAVKELSSEVVDTTKDLSRNVIDTSQGLERALRYRQGVVDAKERLLAAAEEKNASAAATYFKKMIAWRAELMTLRLEDVTLSGSLGARRRARELTSYRNDCLSLALATDQLLGIVH